MALKSMGKICPSVSTTTPQQFTTQSQKEVACVFVSHWSSPPSHATTLFHQLKLLWHPLFHGEEKRHCFHMILPTPCRQTCRRRLSGTTHHTPSCPWSAVIKWKRKKGVRTSFPFSVGDQKRFGIHRRLGLRRAKCLQTFTTRCAKQVMPRSTRRRRGKEVWRQQITGRIICFVISRSSLILYLIWWTC